MTEKIIIEGSKEWGTRVPDEYAITPVLHAKLARSTNEYLVFSFVEPANFMKYDGGFVQKFGEVQLEPDWEEIIIIQNDITSPASYLIRREGEEELELRGNLFKLSGACSPEKPKFAQIFHYSGRTPGAQKSDENAPEWLKDLAYDHNANVAYFKFQKVLNEDGTKRFSFVEEK